MRLSHGGSMAKKGAPGEGSLAAEATLAVERKAKRNWPRRKPPGS